MRTTNVSIHGMVKGSYFSQLIIHGEFNNSLSPLEKGFTFAIRGAGLHGSMLLATVNAARGVFRTLSHI